MQLELNEDEQRDLIAALNVHLMTMRAELAHTDDRDYRRTLRETLVRLELVAKKLSGAASLSAAREPPPAH